MIKQRIIEKDGLIVTHFCGLHTYKDAKEALDELIQINKGKKQIYEIVINEDDIELVFSPAEEQLISNKVNSTLEKFDRGALAVVTSHDFVFGLTRMLDTGTENKHIAVSVFRTEDAARKWIQEIRAMHNRLLKTDGCRSLVLLDPAGNHPNTLRCPNLFVGTLFQNGFFNRNIFR